MGLKKYSLILFLGLVQATLAFPGIRTCEELTAIIGGEPYNFHSSHVPIEWPKALFKAHEITGTAKAKLEHLLESGTFGKIQGVKGVSLPYGIFPVPNERGAIVILHGLKESIPKHLELIHNLNSEGYSVYMMEQRGQAHAGREIKNPQIAYVASYDDYVADTKIFMDTVVDKTPHRMTYLLGNSMGGAIATLYAEKHPEKVDALVPVVPALKVFLHGVPRWLANILIKANHFIGRGKSYAPGQHDFEFSDFLNDPITHSLDRLSRLKWIIETFPMTRIGGPSYDWLGSTLKANDHLRSTPDRLVTPTLLISAGQDNVVDAKAIANFADASPFSSLYEEPDSYHAILFEEDEIRNPTMTEIFRFLVNPARLDAPSRRNQIERLLEDAKSYLDRNEIAFSLYALDEAERVYEWRPEDSPQTQEMRREVAGLKTEVKKTLSESSEGQRGLYQLLSHNRKLEMKKLYPTAVPTP